MPQPIANPPNPFATEDIRYLDGYVPSARLEVYTDRSRSIVAHNDSPDLGFDHSVNPYRGCFHGCSYCYARPSHEYLSFGAGTDFERKITIKPDAAALLRKKFDHPKWSGDMVLFSGGTDCYQPLEASYRLTRACLEVCAEYRNPVGIVTKSPLIERDIDVLKALHAVTHLTISVSIPVYNPASARAVEPYVAPPSRRLDTIARLADAGLDVGINVAPFIPTLSEEDLPALLEKARAAGAVRAAFIFVRLPGNVKAVFEAALRERLPLRADHILKRIRDARGDRLNDPRFGHRFRGHGAYADTVRALFETHARRLGFGGEVRARPRTPTTFRRPPQPGDQLALF